MYKKILWRVGEYFIYGCGIILICILVISGTFYFEAKSYIYASSEEAPKVGAIVIPGAAILRNGTLSPIFTLSAFIYGFLRNSVKTRHMFV